MCFTFSLSFGVGESIVDRPPETDVTTGSRVSDIPYGYYIDSLSPQMIKAFGALNLSSYGNKRIFVGYGVYDKENNKCKFLEGGFTKHEWDLKFHHLKPFSGHSYAISRDTMNFTQCRALAATFHGHLFTPASAVENQAILGNGSALYGEEGWIGIYRQNCIASYKNILDQEIGYSNFFEKIDNCEPDKLFVYKKPYSTLWFKANGEEHKHCIVEFDSPYVTRPVKVCAPWWRIERTYKLPPQKEIMINGVQLDLYNINQATLPRRMTTCLEYDDNITTTTLADREVICKSYYDITMSPTCRAEIVQPQCFVDTCEGYIKNVCSKNPEQPTADGRVKDYVWGYIYENGQKVRVKVKDKIRSHAYTCPPSAASMSKCTLAGDVVVFPYQCNPEVCVQYKRCIGEKTKSRKACHDLFPCEEVYGDSNQPVVENGKLVGFRAKCGEEMVINRNIDKLSKKTEKCLKYKDIVDVVSENKKCTVTATEKRYEVNATITEQDVYSERDDCIRLNDIDDARPRINLVFRYINKGFFDLALVRSTYDGDDNTTVNDAPNSMANDLQYMQRQEVTLEGDSPTVQDGNSVCPAFINDEWKQKRIAIFTRDGSWSGVVGILIGRRGKVVYILNNNADKDAVALQAGVSNNTKHPDYGDYPFDYLGITSSDIDQDNYTFLEGPQLAGDDYFYGIRAAAAGSVPTLGTPASSIDLYASSISRKLTGSECKDLSTCLGLYLETAYATDAEAKVCNVTSNRTTGIIDSTPPDVTQQSVGYPHYRTSEDVIATTIDGTRDIFSIQEFADGKFGYVSNYHYLLPKNNEVYLEGKEIFPIVRQAPLSLPLNYRFYVRNYTQRTKNEEPAIQQGSFEGTQISVDVDYATAIGAGAGVGAAMVLAGLATYAGPVGIVVAVIILLFADDIKYGDLTTIWKIYEPTPLRKAENIYGYDMRETVSGMEIYVRERFLSPTAEDSDFRRFLSDYTAHKKSLLYNQGYEKSLVDSVLVRSCESSVCGGYPEEGDWYDFSWRTERATVENSTIEIHKAVNNLYLGATNTVSIFVPYLGDYIVTAYTSTGNVLGRKLIRAEDFVPGTATRMAYANVNFATSSEFTLAPGMEDGTLSGACRYDMAVEWGGGVSGVYYEHTTPQNNVCAKSNDSYVQANYADYVTIRPLKSNKEFKIKMQKPMPYAARFFLTTYGKLETRKYICYEKEDSCKPN